MWHGLRHQREFRSILVVTKRGQNLKLKGCYYFLKKKKMGVLSTTKFLRDLLHQILIAVAALCVSLCLSHTLGLVDKKDVLDCKEMNSVIGEDHLVEKRDLVHMCLGK